MTTTATGLWAAPHVDRPVEARVVVPGSKSVTNRALLLAALADGPSTLTHPLWARDTRLMMAALRALGATITDAPDTDSPNADSLDTEPLDTEPLDTEPLDTEPLDTVTVSPAPLRGPASVDCGLAGTVMRFVPPVAALALGRIDFDGDPRARERPMGTILGALRTLGVNTTDAVSLPFAIEGAGRVEGGIVTIDASASSQFVSALLLAGARYDRGIDIRHDGKAVPSLPHIEMTVAMLRERGVAVDDSEPDRWVVSPGPVAALDVVIEPDLSNAAPFLAAAVVSGGTVVIPGWPSDTRQAGDRLREILALMGASVDLSPQGLTVRGTGHIRGIDIDLHDVGELTPVIAALAALADGPTQLRGIAHLRGHEVDRLWALSRELQALGTDATETADGLSIRPGPLTGGVFHTYDDHRMAHAGAVLGLAVEDVSVENVATTSKTHPDFVGAWTAMLA